MTDPSRTPTDRDRMPRWVPRAILLFLAGIVSLAILQWMFSQLSPSIFENVSLAGSVTRMPNRRSDDACSLSTRLCVWQ